MKKNILITGATSGIGYFATLEMIRKGHNIIILARNLSRLEHLKQSLLKDNVELDQLTSKIRFYVVDLSDLISIEEFLDKLLTINIPIDTLILNAGLQYTGAKQIRRSFQNIELTFAVNHLSHHYIAQKLIPLLSKSNMPRIVITSSDVHNPETSGGKIGELANLGNLKGLVESSEFKMIGGSSVFNADKAYKDSKLCNILFAKELFRKLNKMELRFSVFCWAPGLVIPKGNDGFFRHSRKYNEIGQIIFAFIARDLLRISESPLNAGRILASLSTLDKYQYKRFIYLANRIKRPGKLNLSESNISPEANDNIKSEKLWNLSNELLGKFVNLDGLID